MSNKSGAPIRRVASGKWQARLFLPDGTRPSLGTYDTEKEAEEAYWIAKAEHERGIWFDASKGRVKFSDFLSRYIEYRSKDWGPGTLRNNLSYAKKHVLPRFGHIAVKDIDVSMIDLWWASMPVGTNRLNVYRFMSGAMTYAVRWKLIQHSPCMVEKPAKGATTKRPRHTEEEFRIVLQHLEEEFVPIFWVIYTAHLRISEAAGLNRGDWNKTTKKLHVVRQLNAATGELSKTKNGEEGVPIGLLNPGTEELEAYIQAHPAFPAAPMFADAQGNRYTSQRLRRAWLAALQQVGMTGADFHVHDLRRVSLTKVMDATGNWKAVKMRGRHLSDTAAMSYQDVSESLDEAVLSVMNGSKSA